MNDKNITCGGNYSIIYDKQGKVSVFRSNGSGELDLGDMKYTIIATLLM